MDISENKIENLELLDILSKMKNLKILYLHGNPVCQKIENYRKKIIFLLKNLVFLDDRPITREERLYAEVIFNTFTKILLNSLNNNNRHFILVVVKLKSK